MKPKLGARGSANLELLVAKCRPFCLPRVLTVVTAAYPPPPDVNAKLAMKELYVAIANNSSSQQFPFLLKSKIVQFRQSLIFLWGLEDEGVMLAINFFPLQTGKPTIGRPLV